MTQSRLTPFSAGGKELLFVADFPAIAAAKENLLYTKNDGSEQRFVGYEEVPVAAVAASVETERFTSADNPHYIGETAVLLAGADYELGRVFFHTSAAVRTFFFNELIVGGRSFIEIQHSNNELWDQVFSNDNLLYTGNFRNARGANAWANAAAVAASIEAGTAHYDPDATNNVYYDISLGQVTKITSFTPAQAATTRQNPLWVMLSTAGVSSRLVLPDENGHLAPGTAEQFRDRIPAIVGNDVLRLEKETNQGHTTYGFWDEVSQAGDQIETPASAAWAAGANHTLDSRVTDGGSKYVCIQAHASAAANRPGTAGGGAYWSLYTVLDLADFIGVHQRVADVAAPGDQDWGYFLYNEFLSTERYYNSGGVLGWLTIGQGPGIDNLLGTFRSQAEATRGVHNFVAGEATVAVFPNGSGEHRLHVLVGYVPAAADQVTYPWRPGRGDIIDGRGNVGLRPPADDGTDDLSLTVTDQGVYWVKKTVHPHTDPAGDWAQYAHANLLGDGQYSFTPGVSQAGQYAFFAGAWRVSVFIPWVGEYDWEITSWRPQHWRGRFNSRTEALNEAVLAGGNGVYATGNAIESLSNFVAGNERTVRRNWDPVNAAGGWSEEDYWYESGEMTNAISQLAGAATPDVPEGFIVNIGGSPARYEVLYPYNPRDNIIGLVITLWEGDTRINTAVRTWGSQFDTTRLYGVASNGLNSHIAFDPDESAHSHGMHRLGLSKNGNFAVAVKFRIHPLYASGGVSSAAISGGASSSTQTAGIANIGIHQEVTLHQYTLPGTTPADPTITWDDTGFLGTTAPWYATDVAAAGAVAGGYTTHWIAKGAGDRSPTGTYTYQPWDKFTPFDVQYSIDGSTLWHQQHNTNDNWARARRANGGYTAPWPITNQPATEIEVWNGSLYHSSGFVSTDVRKFEADWNANLARFTKLRFEVYTFDDFQTGTGVRLAAGQRFETVLTRPAGGWPVVTAIDSTAIGGFHVRYDDLEGLHIGIPEGNGSTTAFEDNIYTGGVAPQRISWMMKFLSPSDSDEAITKMVGLYFPASYHRANLRITGS